MSSLDRCGTYKTPCPKCGGEVEYWYFVLDCRGTPNSSGIQCKKCGKKFASKEWRDKK